MESGSYNTSLMFGVQWDLVLKYLETKGTAQADLKTDSTSWGNYKNNLWNITNANSKYAPNGSGWTLEYATSNSSYPCAGRGGGYSYSGSNYPAAYHNGDGTTSYNGIMSFRISLY